MADIDLRQSIEVLTDLAPGMRKAGIKHAMFGDIAVELEPYYDDTPEELAKLLGDKAEESDEKDPWGDPSTYGEGGGHVPGFSRLRRKRDGK